MLTPRELRAAAAALAVWPAGLGLHRVRPVADDQARLRLALELADDEPLAGIPVSPCVAVARLRGFSRESLTAAWDDLCRLWPAEHGPLWRAIDRQPATAGCVLWALAGEADRASAIRRNRGRQLCRSVGRGGRRGEARRQPHTAH